MWWHTLLIRLLAFVVLIQIVYFLSIVLNDVREWINGKRSALRPGIRKAIKENRDQWRARMDQEAKDRRTLSLINQAENEDEKPYRTIYTPRTPMPEKITTDAGIIPEWEVKNKKS